MAVLDIVAEGVEADFLRFEFYLRRAPEPAGVVDDAHGAQRRGLLGAKFPHAQGGERGDGTGEQGGGAVVARRRPPADQDCIDATLRQRDRRGQAGRPAAHHDRALL